MVEYCNQFLKKIEVIKPYLVEFKKDGCMKSKIYPKDCAVRGSNRQLVIFIPYGKNTLNANNGQRQVWQEKNLSIF